MTAVVASPQLAAQPESDKRAKSVRVGADASTRILVAIVVAVLLLLVGIPLLRVLSTAFGDQGLSEFQRLFSRNFMGIVWNTLVLGAATGLVGTLLGFLLAYAQVRLRFRGKKIFHLISLLPIVSPPFAVATSVITLLGRRGLITYDLFGLDVTIYGLPGLLMVLALSFFPVAYMNFKGLLEHLDPALDEAAASMGASRWKIFATVTLPMTIPGFAGSFLLLFVEAIADLANPLAIGGDFQVLASKAYMTITGDYNLGGGAAYCVVLLVPALLVFLVQRYWVSKKEVVSVTGKPAGKPQQMAAGGGYWAILVGAWVVIGVIVIVYGTVVFGSFFRSLGIDNSLTLDNFVWAFEGNGAAAMVTTTIIALIATPIAGLLGMLISWLVVRKLKHGAGAMDFIGMLGLAVPGTVVGIGYMLAFNQGVVTNGYMIWPPLTGGHAILAGALGIVLVYVIRSMPSGQRAGVAALQQIDPAIDEASTSLGASGARTFRKITLPIIRPAFLSGLTYSFARSMTTLSPIIFITTPQTRILTSEIFAEVNAGRFGHAFSYCTVLLVIVMAVIGLMNLIVRDRSTSMPAAGLGA